MIPLLRSLSSGSRVSSRLGAGLLVLALAACGGGPKNEAYIEKPVDDLYNTAMDQLADEKYDRATKTFGEVESQIARAVDLKRGVADQQSGVI